MIGVEYGMYLCESDFVVQCFDDILILAKKFVLSHLVRHAQLDGAQVPTVCDTETDGLVELAVVDKEVHAAQEHLRIEAATVPVMIIIRCIYPLPQASFARFFILNFFARNLIYRDQTTCSQGGLQVAIPAHMVLPVIYSV